ncbi:MAG: T9SS type A sorting domain-containing protein [Ignavibacteriales bacterium]|nr:T9SS type A sorting domain-containing protein [Ignavibacteriales bacterium]
MCGKYKSFFIIAFFMILFTVTLSAQGRDSIYHRTFIYHSDKSICDHKLPDVSFTLFLDRTEKNILIESSPRWDPNGSSNIQSGSFGIELANFRNPNIYVGDSVFFRFNCASKKEQGFLATKLPSIPWVFSQSITMNKVTLPPKPQNIILTKDSISGFRTITWSVIQQSNYKIYRRDLDDLSPFGQQRKMYFLLSNTAAGYFVDSTSGLNKRYGYILFPVSELGIVGMHSDEVNEEPVIGLGDDLTIRYIQRQSVISWIWNAEDPKRQGWPSAGQKIFWQANVKNWFNKSLTNINYKWFLDDIVADSGTVSINAGDTANVSLPWNWTFERHELKFVIDTDNKFFEEEEQNNDLTVYTDAITVGLYVEQGVYNYFKQYQKELGVHSNSWEDWAQRHIKRWNQMLANAKYPESPDGVLDRIRLDKITVVPDGALPLAGGLPTNNPNLNDRTVDLQWGFPATGIPPQSNFYSNHTNAGDNNPFYFEGSLFHELGHARYLIDLYGFNVHDNGSGNTVAIKEKGKLIVGTPYMPLSGDAVHYTQFLGLMNGQYTYIDRYSAPALNLIAGHRAVQGNCNSPGNIGIFMNDLPSENILTLKDDSGNLLRNANLKIYQATGQTGVWYGKYFDNLPDLSFITDSLGRVDVGRCPFSKNGNITHDYGISNCVLILRVEYEGKIGYTFLESTYFNLEYWKGNTETANYDVKVNLVTATGVEENQIIENFIFDLEQNYPNPFNPQTVIKWQLPVGSYTTLKVYDLLGREVAELVNDFKPAGKYQIEFDASALPSGIYLYTLTAGSFSESKKMIILK